MGLDMTAYSLENAPEAEVDFPCGGNLVEIAYWRKHPNLHGWMEQLYRKKGGADEYFNCSAVALSTEDINKLEKELDNLPPTTGFFFGHSRPEDRHLDLAFIARAREEIAKGRTICYSAWW